MPTDDEIAKRQQATLPADKARAILLVRAFEEADRHGSFLSPGERSQATRVARLPSGPPLDAAAEGEFLAARAQHLLPTLEARSPFELRSLLEGWHGPKPAWFLIPAVLLGLFTNALGPSQHINVLAVPLLGLLLWNFAVYAIALLGVLRHPRRAARGERSSGALIQRAAGSYLALLWRKLKRGRSQDTIITTDATTRYIESWSSRALPMLSSHLIAGLHLGAAGMAAGAVAGMYQRGLLSKYMATWESTFLSADAADLCLKIMLAPASALLGLELPSVREFTAPEVYPAADWIHAWALTVALGIVVPRMLLWSRERFRVRRLEQQVKLPLGGEYYRALLSPDRGTRSSVRILPYSYRPEPRRADNLRAMMHDAFGARAEIQIGERLEYGAELEDLPSPPAGDIGQVRITWILFALAQSPELEVHAEFLVELRQALEAGESIGVIIDASSFMDRLHDLPEAERRLEERQRAWDRVVREARLEAQHVNLDELASNEQVSQLPSALHSDSQTMERPA
ncbi:MAG: hypothetical protein ACI841_001061 [Planctomycetota bacterium]|jgi:hypothetical protein